MEALQILSLTYFIPGISAAVVMLLKLIKDWRKLNGISKAIEVVEIIILIVSGLFGSILLTLIFYKNKIVKNKQK